MFIRPIAETIKSDEDQVEANKPIELRFDPEWYADRYPSVKMLVDNGLFKSEREHFQTVGSREGFQPNPFFCPSYVRRQLGKLQDDTNADCRNAYLENVETQCLSPHWMFSERKYRAENPKVESAVAAGDLTSGFTYYVRWENQMAVRPSVLFDPKYFLAQPGIQATDKPFNAFAKGRFHENISTSILFDAEYYRSSNNEAEPVVGRGKYFETFIHHFVEVGIYKDFKFLPDFDRGFYLEENPEVAEGVQNGDFSATEHFLLHGLKEGRAPNPYFDPAYYVERQPEALEEVRAMGLSGVFEHFLRTGAKRGFVPRRPLVSTHVKPEPAKALFEKRARLTAQNIFLGGRRHSFPRHDEVDVSCVLPVCDQADFTYHVLRQLCAIAADPAGPKIEVIVVDNGSTDRTTELDRWFENLAVVREERPLGYTRACNLGAQAARGRNLLFMNNDMELSPDAIRFACETVDAADVGAAGGRIVLPDGTLQEAGNTIWQDGSCKGDGRGDDPADMRYMYPRDVDYCSGCFLIVKRALFEELDGFSEEFAPGYYEETDLCARLWRMGKRVVYDPRIYVTHYEYASFSSGRPPTVSHSIMARHRKAFRRRNAEFLAAQPRHSPQAMTRLRDRSGRGMPHVFVFDDLLPDPAFGSGFTRTFSIVEAFLALGWRVTVWAKQNRGTGIDRALEARGVTVRLGESLDESAGDYLRRNCADIDLFWCCRTHNSEAAAQIAAVLGDRRPRPHFVFDTEAIAATREISYQKLLGVDISDRAERMVREELRHAEGLGTIVVVNDLDRQSVESAIGKRPAVLGHRLAADPQPVPFEDRRGILFCGAIHEEHSPNLDSLLWYLRNVHPRVRDALPEATFRIVGYWNPSLTMPKIFKSANGVEFVGPVSDAGLTQEIAAARVFAAPTRYAGGIPYKVHYAMSLGLPAVVTPVLRRQLAEAGVPPGDVPLLGPDGLDPAGFAEAVVRLHTDAGLWSDLRSRGLDYIGKHCSAKGYAEKIEKIVEYAIID